MRVFSVILGIVLSVASVVVPSVYAEPQSKSENPSKPGLSAFVAPVPEAKTEANKDISEDLNPGRPIALSDEMIASMAEQLGLDPRSEQMQHIVTSYYQTRDREAAGEESQDETQGFLENADDDEDPNSPTRHEVIRHFRGKAGIPLPNKDDIPFPFKVTEENLKQAFEDYFKVVNQFLEANTTPAKLPKCTKNETTKTETGYTDDEKPEELIADILFLDKRDVPLDVEEVFGKKTMARPYNANEPNFETLGALGIGVDCLPFRWRVTRKYLIKDTGKNALKNYDKDQFGEGEYSEYMKAKLGITE
ncbi:MAG: hypothetical protein K1X79_11665 [Oligoflexia bacterium]|nr:hypothetical protein [Oligoflexia bacterium]